ncbi:MAG: GAF domain-containing protein [Acidobacteriia bacterium]|nr:GAF domain-containing protein [Terriglobia bacterium]
MNRHPILSLSSPQRAQESVPSDADSGEPAAGPPAGREPLRFPGDDGGKSLAEMAQRDLQAALQLLAERAQYITGASGAAIALREDAHMICRASAGTSAPELGAHLQVNSGLSGESVRTRQLLRCDDAETDTRVNRESCRALGIASVVVMPLLREQEVTGVFELFSSHAYAFEERDITALERIAEMIQTAVDQADAVKRAQTQISGDDKDDKEKEEDILLADDGEEGSQPGSKAEPAPASETATPATELPHPNLQSAVVPDAAPRVEEKPPQAVLLGEPGSIHKCAACGFPVSQGRTLCLDCEAAQTPPEKVVLRAEVGEAPGFLAEYASAGNKRSWLRYWIGGLLLVGTAATVLHWLR